jgi:hypothetical protein
MLTSSSSGTAQDHRGNELKRIFRFGFLSVLLLVLSTGALDTVIRDPVAQEAAEARGWTASLEEIPANRGTPEWANSKLAETRRVHGYFWAYVRGEQGKETANASAAKLIAHSFVRNLTQSRGLIDGLVVVRAVKNRVVVNHEDARLSYVLIEPNYVEPVARLHGASKGVPPPELQELWEYAATHGIKLYGGLGLLPTNWSYVGPNESAPNYDDISNPSYPWHEPSREWFQVDVYHPDFEWRSLAPTVDSIVRTCRELDLSGIVVNDEAGWWKPRSSQRDFEAFVFYADRLAEALHTHGLELYVTMALPHEMDTSVEEIKTMLHQSPVDRWVFMDPYWGTLNHTEAHVANWSRPYSYHGRSGIGNKYAPLIWNHPAAQFGTNSTKPMAQLLEYIGVETRVDDLWIWDLPSAILSPSFVSHVLDWKFAREGFA